MEKQVDEEELLVIKHLQRKKIRIDISNDITWDLQMIFSVEGREFQLRTSADAGFWNWPPSESNEEGKWIWAWHETINKVNGAIEQIKKEWAEKEQAKKFVQDDEFDNKF